MKTLSAFFFLLILSSCSYIIPDSGNFISDDYKLHTTSDYRDQLEYLGLVYEKNHKNSIYKTSRKAEDYIDFIMNGLITNNELLFNVDYFPKVTIIKQNRPYHFSVPGGNIYLSTGLLKRYVKYEGLLVAILTTELIKSTKNIYQKRLIIPTGHIDNKHILKLTGLSFREKTQINKWAFYVMKRSGHDPYSILRLIQVKNKNSIDFANQIPDLKSISREETLFKNFIVESGHTDLDESTIKNSSQGFYRFMDEINRI